MTVFVFSDTINAFLLRIRAEIFYILENEVGAKISGDFFNLPGVRCRPSVVIFEDSKRMGYYNPSKIEIGVHREIMFIMDKETVRNILRHEIAHMLVHLYLGEVETGHGVAFRSYCNLLGWGEEVSRASMASAWLESQGSSTNSESDRIMSKVKKLLALSSSDNPHEAYAATLMANRLLIRHNLAILDKTYIDGSKEIFMKRVLEVRRFSAKHHTIADILSYFLVSPVLSHGRGVSYLEVTGERTNVRIAEYVAHFMDRRLEELWQAAKKMNTGLGGHVAKNSFMRGVAAGYREKMERAYRGYTQDEGLALVLTQTRLRSLLSIVYGRLTPPRTRGFFCPESFGAGWEEGKRLSILKGIAVSSAVKPLLKA